MEYIRRESDEEYDDVCYYSSISYWNHGLYFCVLVWQKEEKEISFRWKGIYIHKFTPFIHTNSGIKVTLNGTET